jgi:glucan biosynthesis protein
MSTLTTDEELKLIQDAIILPLMKKMLAKKMSEIEYSPQPLRKLYLRVTEIVLDRVQKDLVEVKKQLRKSDIRVWQDENISVKEFRYHYLVRGYQFTFDMLRDKVKAEISMRLPKYVNLVMNDLNAKR